MNRVIVSKFSYIPCKLYTKLVKFPREVHKSVPWVFFRIHFPREKFHLIFVVRNYFMFSNYGS